MFYSPSNNYDNLSVVSVKQSNAKQTDLLDASSSIFMVSSKLKSQIVECLKRSKSDNSILSLKKKLNRVYKKKKLIESKKKKI